MSDLCEECGKLTYSRDCPVGHDDGELVYVCDACRRQAVIDDHNAERASEAETTDARGKPRHA
jgi:hypothetical protein